MYVETTEGLAGEQELINKFGLEIREETTFMLSKRRWNDAVDSEHTMIKEVDLMKAILFIIHY